MPSLLPSNVGVPGREGTKPARGCADGIVICPDSLPPSWPSGIIVPQYTHCVVSGAATTHSPPCTCAASVNGTWTQECFGAGGNPPRTQNWQDLLQVSGTCPSYTWHNGFAYDDCADSGSTCGMRVVCIFTLSPNEVEIRCFPEDSGSKTFSASLVRTEASFPGGVYPTDLLTSMSSLDLPDITFFSGGHNCGPNISAPTSVVVSAGTP